MRDVDLLASGVLTRQHGVIGLDQARRVGFSDDQVRHRVRRGTWTAVRRGVYRHHHWAPSWHGELLAACLVTGGVVSHAAAAHLWRLDGFVDAPSPEITVQHGRSPGLAGVLVHETTRADQLSPCVIGGLVTTGCARTLFDLAGVCGHARLTRATDDARRRGLVTLDELVTTLDAHARRGRNGTVRFRRHLELRLAEERLPRSYWSRQVADLLVAAGLPCPHLEHRVDDGRGFTAELNLAWPGHQVGAELDSVAWHMDRRHFEADPRRRNRLENLGWSIRNFTWADFVDRPWEIVVTMRLALERAAAAAA